MSVVVSTPTDTTDWALAPYMAEVRSLGPTMRAAVALCVVLGEDPTTLTSVGAVTLTAAQRAELPRMVAITKTVHELRAEARTWARRAFLLALAHDLGPES